MLITIDQLRAIMPNAGERARIYFMPLTQSIVDFDIDNRLRVAAFLAQIAHESGELRYAREIWGPTASQLRYSDRDDLGNTNPIAIQAAEHNGDNTGHFYRGRGLIQITGYYNYVDATEALGVDFVTNPKLAELPDFSARIAAWFWKTHGCNPLADEKKFKTITRRINGGLNGYDDRLKYYNKALTVL